MANKVVNNGFETTLGALTGWQKWWNTSPTPLPTGNDVVAHEIDPKEGVQCAKTTKTIALTVLELYRWILPTDPNGGIEENHRYTVSCWLKVLDGASVTKGSISLTLNGYNSSNALLPQNDESAYFHYNDPAQHTHDWVQLSYVTQPMPAGTDRGVVDLRVSGDFAGTVLWDDVSVEEFAEPEYSIGISYPTTKNNWYPGLHTNTVTVTGVVKACDSSLALDAMESKAALYSPTDVLIQQLDAVDIPASGIITHTFTDQITPATTGNYKVRVIIAQKSDHAAIITKDITLTVNDAEAVEPTIYFDSKGRLVDNGVLTFPIIGYCDSTFSLANIINCGLKYLMPYYPLYLPDTNGFSAWIAARYAYGVKSLLPLHAYFYGKYDIHYENWINNKTAMVDAITDLVTAYKDNDGIFGYNLSDDTYDKNDIQLAAHKAAIIALDKLKPIWDPISGSRSDFISRFDYSDVQGQYVYPCINYLTNPTLYPIISEIARMHTGFLRYKNYTPTGRPLWHIIESTQIASSSEHPLTLQIMMLEAIIAIIDGATGLSLWSAGRAFSASECDADMPTKISYTIAKLQSLNDVLVGDELTGASAVTVSGEGLISKTFSCNGKPYCFVANMTDAAISATITFPSTAIRIKSDNMIGAYSNKTATANAITENIESLGSRLYSLPEEESGGGGSFTWSIASDAKTLDVIETDISIENKNTVNIFNDTDKTVTITLNILEGLAVSPIKTITLDTKKGKSFQVSGLYSSGTLRIIATPASACSGNVIVNIY